MQDLQNRLMSFTDGVGGSWSILVARPGEYAEDETNQSYMMASLSKLAILLYILDNWDSSTLIRKFGNPGIVTLEPRHLLNSSGQPIGGTGILRHFKPGLKLHIYDVVRLMVVESDNVAAAILLSYINGGQAEVVQYLTTEYTLSRVGLTKRTDRFFESDVATATEMFTIWSLVWDRIHGLRALGWSNLDEAFKRSHFRAGFKYPDSPGGLLYGRPVTAAAMLTGKLGIPALQKELIQRVLSRPMSFVATKEGALDWEGEAFRHEVGAFPIRKGEVILVGVFSRSRQLGYSPDHPAWLMNRRIAKEVCNSR